MTYPLDVVLLVVVLAAVCGFTSNYAIAEFWTAHRSTFERLINDFPKADISHDTVRRLIKLLGSRDASKLLRRLTEPLVQALAQRIIRVYLLIVGNPVNRQSVLFVNKRYNQTLP